jgi:hypothetical protein
MPYVYRHIRLDKNEPFYIGIGSDMAYKRSREKSRRSNLWNKIIAKSDYDVEILIDDITFDEAKLKEIEFIKLYGRIDLGNGTLANLTDGGDGAINRIFTPEHRRKLSLSQIGKEKSEETKAKLRTYRLGIPNSPEARAKISKANKGRVNSPELMELLHNRKGEKNPVFGITGAKCKNFKGFIEVFKDGLNLGKYEGIRECAEKFNVTATKISAVLHGRRNHTGGYKFKRISNDAQN